MYLYNDMYVYNYVQWIDTAEMSPSLSASTPGLLYVYSALLSQVHVHSRHLVGFQGYRMSHVELHSEVQFLKAFLERMLLCFLFLIFFLLSFKLSNLLSYFSFPLMWRAFVRPGSSCWALLQNASIPAPAIPDYCLFPALALSFSRSGRPVSVGLSVLLEPVHSW